MTILFTEYFKKQIKKLKKKFPHVKEDLLNVLEKLRIENEISIGRSIYKIRIRSRDMKKGKSGSFRCYIYLYRQKELLIPLSIYTKSEKEMLTENELTYHFGKTIEEVSHLI